MKTYKPKPVPCDLCDALDSTLIVNCIIEEQIKTLNVCVNCKNKIPYETIPVNTTMDVGYYFVKNVSN